VNPLADADGDAFVLHFYDLSAKQAHTMYRFEWKKEESSDLAPELASTPMET
jgi:hypothetical protein